MTAVCHFLSSPFLLFEKGKKRGGGNQDQETSAAYSFLYVRTFPQMEATMLCSKQAVWEERDWEPSTFVSLLMKQEKYTFVCFATWLLHRVLKLGMERAGQDEWGR